MTEQSCVVVCVTQQPECGRLIQAGKKIAGEYGLSLQVLNIQPEGNCFTPNPQAMENLYRESRDADASMTVYFHNDPAFVAAGHARKVGAAMLVTGFPGENTSRFLADIHMLLPKMPICMVDQDGKMYHMLAQGVDLPKRSAVTARG